MSSPQQAEPALELRRAADRGGLSDCSDGAGLLHAKHRRDHNTEVAARLIDHLTAIEPGR